MGTTTIMVQRGDSASRTATLKDDPTQDGTRGYHFGSGDTLEIAIDHTSLPSGTVFKSISFFPTANESPPAGDQSWVRLDLANLPAGSAVIAGRRVYAGPATAMFNVTWTASDLSQPIRIADDEALNREDCAWFQIVVTDPSGADWTLDPELVNTGGGGSSSWGPVRPATMAEMAMI